MTNNTNANNNLTENINSNNNYNTNINNNSNTNTNNNTKREEKEKNEEKDKEKIKNKLCNLNQNLNMEKNETQKEIELKSSNFSEGIYKNTESSLKKQGSLPLKNNSNYENENNKNSDLEKKINLKNLRSKIRENLIGSTNREKAIQLNSDGFFGKKENLKMILQKSNSQKSAKCVNKNSNNNYFITERNLKSRINFDKINMKELEFVSNEKYRNSYNNSKGFNSDSNLFNRKNTFNSSNKKNNFKDLKEFNLNLKETGKFSSTNSIVDLGKFNSTGSNNNNNIDLNKFNSSNSNKEDQATKILSNSFSQNKAIMLTENNLNAYDKLENININNNNNNSNRNFNTGNDNSVIIGENVNINFNNNFINNINNNNINNKENNSNNNNNKNNTFNNISNNPNISIFNNFIFPFNGKERQSATNKKQQENINLNINSVNINTFNINQVNNNNNSNNNNNTYSNTNNNFSNNNNKNYNNFISLTETPELFKYKSLKEKKHQIPNKLSDNYLSSDRDKDKDKDYKEQSILKTECNTNTNSNKNINLNLNTNTNTNQNKNIKSNLITNANSNINTCTFTNSNENLSKNLNINTKTNPLTKSDKKKNYKTETEEAEIFNEKERENEKILKRYSYNFPKQYFSIGYILIIIACKSIKLKIFDYLEKITFANLEEIKKLRIKKCCLFHFLISLEEGIKIKKKYSIENFFKFYSDDFRNFICNLTTISMSNRPQTKKKCLQGNPIYNLNSRRLMEHPWLKTKPEKFFNLYKKKLSTLNLKISLKEIIKIVRESFKTSLIDFNEKRYLDVLNKLEIIVNNHKNELRLDNVKEIISSKKNIIKKISVDLGVSYHIFFEKILCLIQDVFKD
jgi:hypothetical protein